MMVKKITKYHVLEEFSAGSALLFAVSHCHSCAFAPRPADIVCNNLFLPVLFSRASVPLR
jgi:hypothetical protein